MIILLAVISAKLFDNAISIIKSWFDLRPIFYMKMKNLFLCLFKLFSSAKGRVILFSLQKFFKILFYILAILIVILVPRLHRAVEKAIQYAEEKNQLENSFTDFNQNYMLDYKRFDFNGITRDYIDSDGDLVDKMLMRLSQIKYRSIS